MNETIQIDTPENVAFGYSVAGIGSRFMAALVDSVVIVILEILTYLLLYVVVIRVAGAVWGSWMLAVISLVAFLLLWGYYIFFEMLWNGQSLGKRWVGLRVIRADGMPISLAESIIRNLVRLIDFMPFAYGVGVVTMFISSQSRRLGDLAAGTVVVHDHGSIALPTLAEAPRPVVKTPPEGFNPSAGLPVQLLTNQDILLLQEFFTRQQNIVQGDALAVKILAMLYQRMGITDRPVEPGSVRNALAEIQMALRNYEPPQKK